MYLYVQHELPPDGGTGECLSALQLLSMLDCRNHTGMYAACTAACFHLWICVALALILRRRSDDLRSCYVLVVIASRRQ